MQTLTEESLIAILKETLHPTQASTYLSGSFFEELECQNNYLEILMKIVYNPENPLEIRQLAIINVKNCVNRKWWSHPPGNQSTYLTDEIKNAFAESLLYYLSTPLQNVALINQLSLIIARVARIDYPTRLSNYFSIVQSLMNNSNLQVAYQGINSLLCFVRTFSTCRVGKQRQQFLALTNELLPFIMTHISKYMTQLQNQQYDSTDFTIICENLHCLMSSLFKVIVRGVMKMNNELSQQLPYTLQQLLTIVPVCLSQSSFLTNSSLLKAIKWCLKICDTFCSQQAPSSSSSSSLYQSLADLCLSILFSISSVNEQSSLTDFLPILTIINHSLSFLLSKAQSIEGISAFFNDDCITKLLFCLYSSMLPLSSQQMEDLLNNHEEAYWEFMNSFYRSTVISLYEMIAKQYPEQTVNFIQQQYSLLLSESTTPSQLFSFLCMIERGGGYIARYLNYQQLYVDLIYPILSKHNHAVVVMECILVVKSSYHLFSSSEQESCISFLSSLVTLPFLTVQLASFDCIMSLLQTYQSSQCLIHTHFTSILSNAISFYFNASSSETKLFLLSFLSVFFEKQSSLEEYSEMILSSFQTLWNDVWNSTDYSSLLHVFRLSIILVKVHPVLLTNCPDFFFPIIGFALTSSNEDIRLLLFEDALTLWNCVLHLPNLTYTEAIHSLFQQYLTLYSNDMKVFPVLMNILDQYIMLGKQLFLQAYLTSLIPVYSSFFQLVSTRDLPRLVTSLHSLLLLYPDEGMQLVSPLVLPLLNALITKHQEEQIERHSESIFVSYLVIICQLVLYQEKGATILNDACQTLQLNNQSFFSLLLSSLLESFDSAGGGAVGYIRRTLFVQCMLCCIYHGIPDLLSSLEEVCDCIVNVVAEIEVGEEKMRLLFSEKTSMRDGFSEDYLRKFIAQSNIQESLNGFVQNLKQSIGENQVQEIFSKIHPMILQQLSPLLSL